jgi:hypothetical protein
MVAFESCMLFPLCVLYVVDVHTGECSNWQRYISTQVDIIRISHCGTFIHPNNVISYFNNHYMKQCS